ncbi:hypothetical protein ACPOL_5187 [Acidisarcina polymorpha]|uniref:Endo-polygalacturonase n=1 Tax=Acidisarcina polymorpha TaxID=2211140 RepID=A0A2Z5G5R9_9BACT|nr:glycosyl hydrolase family 28 protein [Acidisarcina polymorpha]AXC14441.1 hypothetical protein ACPOL_5187 [Acidisarcina polymorpha]
MSTYLGWSFCPFTHKSCRPLFALMLSLPLLFASSLQAQLVSHVYPAAVGEPQSTLFKVAVGGQSSPVYLASVGSLTGPMLNRELVGKASFTSFDIKGPVQVSVTYAKPIQQVKILPASNVELSVSGNQVTFTMSKASQLTLEINGDWNNSLHLFANPFETNIPSPADPNVLYFGPGIHFVQSMNVKSGQTVYLAEGAILYWRLTPGQTSGALFNLIGSNIVLRGRGIIDSSLVPQIPNGDLIYASVNGLTVEGVTLRDAANWTFHINTSRNVQVSNIKVFGWRLNSDGTDVDSSQNVTIANSFYRTYDDLVAIKTDNTVGSATNVTVKGCVLWNEKGHALTVGSELKQAANDILFTDSYVIHDKGHDALLAVFDGDSGVVSDVTFENLQVEESMRLISLYVGLTAWSSSSNRGKINDVIFRNIIAPVPSRTGPNLDLEGFSSLNGVDNISFENVTVGGLPLQLNEVQQNQFVGGLMVTPRRRH